MRRSGSSSSSRCRRTSAHLGCQTSGARTVLACSAVSSAARIFCASCPKTGACRSRCTCMYVGFACRPRAPLLSCRAQLLRSRPWGTQGTCRYRSSGTRCGTCRTSPSAVVGDVAAASYQPSQRMPREQPPRRNPQETHLRRRGPPFLAAWAGLPGVAAVRLNH